MYVCMYMYIYVCIYITFLSFIYIYVKIPKKDFFRLLKLRAYFKDANETQT